MTLEPTTRHNRTLRAAGRLELRANLAAINATSNPAPFSIEAIRAADKATRLWNRAARLCHALQDREDARTREQAAKRKPTRPSKKLR